MLELTGLGIGAAVVRIARSRPSRLLRAAILAQAADLVLFTFIWRNSLAYEHNPLANLVFENTLSVVGSDYWLATMLSVAVLVGFKLALIAYLVWAAPMLGRYRQPVLLVATAAGIIGAGSNFIALPIFAGPGG